MTNRRPCSALGVVAVGVVAVGLGACKTAPAGPHPASFPDSSGPGAKPQNSAGSVTPAGLVGHWRSETEQLDIQPNGTVLINGVSYAYSVSGTMLEVQGQSTSASYPFALDGNKLTVTLNGQPVVYTRIEAPTFVPTPTATDTVPLARIAGDGPPMNPAGAGPSATPSTPATAAGGSVVPELVGKWCFMSNVNANDGGRQSNTCFALNGDGTYWYHAETSSSGQYGGTAAQSDDQGRWVASGNTLTASSSTGKTTSYTFEKQNHPKTRDPMLVINGQAFVTYFQKAPW